MLDLSDAIQTLRFLFQGLAEIGCAKAGDSNDSGSLDLSDAVYLLSALFLGTALPPPPYRICGPDVTGDHLGCDTYPACD
jgi:hypothetical protein